MGQRRLLARGGGNQRRPLLAQRPGLLLRRITRHHRFTNLAREAGVLFCGLGQLRFALPARVVDQRDALLKITQRALGCRHRSLLAAGLFRQRCQRAAEAVQRLLRSGGLGLALLAARLQRLILLGGGGKGGALVFQVRFERTDLRQGAGQIMGMGLDRAVAAGQFSACSLQRGLRLRERSVDARRLLAHRFSLAAHRLQFRLQAVLLRQALL